MGIMENTGKLYKRQAAEAAVDAVASGMIVGLGHGSTARFAVERIGELLRFGMLRDIQGVPCSMQVVETARAFEVPLTTLEEHPVLDVTIDGADEVSPELHLIKGGGGALLREKIVAQASRRVIIVVDESKMVPVLGVHAPLPVEVLPFGWVSQRDYLTALGAVVTLRMSGNTPSLTDQGNYLLDCRFGAITQPAVLAEQLQVRAGILEHGLFLGVADEAVVAGTHGVQRLVRT